MCPLTNFFTPSQITWATKQLFLNAIQATCIYGLHTCGTLPSACPLHLLDVVEETAKSHCGVLENRHGVNFYIMMQSRDKLNEAVQKKAQAQ